MNRFARFASIALLLGAATAGTASATTYYIAASGSDSNSGTAKSSPWQHAPGMPNCTATCASTTPQAGDSFIFRGGDTWHFKANTAPAVGGTWNWGWSGSGGNAIYVGVDTSWSSGGSFQRPIMNMDNPQSRSLVSSCAFDETTFTALKVSVVHDVTIDNFNFTGMCWQGIPNNIAYIYRQGTNITISNSYFHGWTEVNNPQCNGCAPYDQANMIGGAGNAGASHNVLAYDVFDGSDSFCSGNRACSGLAVYTDAYDVHNCVFRYLANALNSPNNFVTVHDNLFEFIYESFDPADHGGVAEAYGALANTPQYFYNNIIRHTNIGVGYNPNADGPIYIFNNVSYDNINTGNCVMLGGNGAASTAFIANNTFDSTCHVRIMANGQGNPSGFSGTVNFQNNHFIGFSSAALSATVNNGNSGQANVVDNGNEVFESTAQASSDGYTASNNYAPTSGSGATIGAGANLQAQCSLFSADSALCSGTSDAVVEGSGNVAVFPAIAMNARPLSGSWQAGAYFFGGATSTRPNPPTNLAATAQ